MGGRGKDQGLVGLFILLFERMESMTTFLDLPYDVLLQHILAPFGTADPQMAYNEPRNLMRFRLTCKYLYAALAHFPWLSQLPGLSDDTASLTFSWRLTLKTAGHVFALHRSGDPSLMDPRYASSRTVVTLKRGLDLLACAIKYDVPERYKQLATQRDDVFKGKPLGLLMKPHLLNKLALEHDRAWVMDLTAGVDAPLNFAGPSAALCMRADALDCLKHHYERRVRNGAIRLTVLLSFKRSVQQSCRGKPDALPRIRAWVTTAYAEALAQQAARAGTVKRRLDFADAADDEPAAKKPRLTPTVVIDLVEDDDDA